ncbi:hypothetical protein SCHPADRAFT_722030 [Schizopora paradoxa]|uniref:Uncharacterized protein n=1 Tax=Schizopora paradoxa TaxID=27342 RepID=A0A0H2R170_9AGAM|nr:hypothetical protein SCHPADRAFT_722030 [Schizopora paradoxa]
MLQRTLRVNRSRFTSVSRLSMPPSLLRMDDAENGEFGFEDDGTLDQFRRSIRLGRGNQAFVPLGGEFGVLLALSLSLLFIFAISLSFTNANDALYFKKTLDNTAKFDPGVVLVGEDVDVDIEEPAVGVRWRIAGCGEGFTLRGSSPLHGSASCGVLATSVKVYIDGSASKPNQTWRTILISCFVVIPSSKDAIAEFDPASVPREPVTNRLMLVQNLMHFDSRHALDVHNARFYPFDTYSLTTTLRVEYSNSTSESDSDFGSLRISASPIVMYTSSFMAVSTSRQGNLLIDSSTFPVRHIEVRIKRPGPARAYAMLLFGMNWLLAHSALGVFVFAKRAKSTFPLGLVSLTRERVLHDALKQLGIVFGILLAMPKLRAMMPNAPGFDGVLIDTVGYFPQMTMAGFSLVLLLLLTASRILDAAPSISSRGKMKRFDPPAFTFTRTTLDGLRGGQKLEQVDEDVQYNCPSGPFGGMETFESRRWYYNRTRTGSLEDAVPPWSSPSPLPRSTGQNDLLRGLRSGC